MSMLSLCQMFILFMPGASLINRPRTGLAGAVQAPDKTVKNGGLYAGVCSSAIEQGACSEGLLLLLGCSRLR